MAAGSRPCAPLLVTVNVTTRCNLDCVYCYMQPLSGLDMPRSDFERIIDELADQGVFLLTLSGGETFLHPEFPALFRYAHRRFAHVMTLTNGTAMRPRHVDAIRQVLDDKGAVTIQVSLDAVDPRMNALTRAPSRRTLRTIQELASIGCHVIVAIVVTRHNVAAVVPTIEALSAYTRWFHVMTVQDIRANAGLERELGAQKEMRDSLWSELHALADQRDLAINFPANDCEAGCAEGAPCMAGFSTFVIDPDLNVRPCDRMTNVILGNLGHASVSDVWNGAATLAVIDRAEPICRPTLIPAMPFAVERATGIGSV
jgi:MoaA/NifB/PqqE/SkfB family radical SAM enzyme